MSRPNFSIHSLLLFFGFLLTGCGGGVEQPKLAPANGTVTLDGSPAAGVLVTFIPSASTEGNGGMTMTDEAGKYEITHRSGEPGIQPGQYSVIFSKFETPDGKSIEPDVQPESVGAKQVLPANYTSADKTDQQVQVGEAGGTFDFDLQSK